MTTPAIDPDILIARFKRSGGDGVRTRLVENFPADERKMLLREAALDRGERPLIAYLGGSEDWLLVTTQWIRYAGSGERISIRVVDITRVGHDLKSEAAQHGVNKGNWRELTIEGRDRGCIVADLEPGAAFFTVWNTLLWVWRWSEAQRERGLA